MYLDVERISTSFLPIPEMSIFPPRQSTIQISPLSNGCEQITISPFVSSYKSSFDFFDVRVSETLIAHHVSPPTDS
jgi:hypothetical protein